jgi:glycopeptide antibiotics resistance protein
MASPLRHTGSPINELISHWKNRALMLPICAISVLTLAPFQGSELSLYLDGKRESHGLVLGPGAALFRRMFRLRMYNLRALKVFYRLILFIPLGALLAFLSRRTGRNAWGKWATTAIAVVVSPLAIVLTLTMVSGRSFRWTDLFVGVGLTLAAILITNSDRESSYIE